MCINPAKADYEAQEQRYEAEKKAILARHGLELGHCQPGLPAGATPLLSVETPGLRKTEEPDFQYRTTYYRARQDGDV
ncbi:MAG: hypothetical protein KatS3mg071_1726 [Meiothermus sp.]|nr:MAG: hypothetical protein KatS3mg071_1726 [Meiothermus sp.]